MHYSQSTACSGYMVRRMDVPERHMKRAWLILAGFRAIVVDWNLIIDRCNLQAPFFQVFEARYAQK